MTPEASVNDEVFLKARKMSDEFDKELRSLLFNTNDEFTELVQLYGVF